MSRVGYAIATKKHRLLHKAIMRTGKGAPELVRENPQWGLTDFSCHEIGYLIDQAITDFRQELDESKREVPMSKNEMKPTREESFHDLIIESDEMTIGDLFPTMTKTRFSSKYARI